MGTEIVAVPIVVSREARTQEAMSCCGFCRWRRQHTVAMVHDAFQLTVVFTVVPVVPLATIEAHLAWGAWGSLITVMLFYGGFPSALGFLMWVTLTRKRGAICRQAGTTAMSTDGAA